MTKITCARPEHMPGILALEKECFSLPWSEKSFLFELESHDAHFTVAEEGEKLCGFCILHRLCDDGEIFNVAVSPEKRRHGVGGALIDDALRAAKAMEIKRIYLEVRKSNDPAQKLYRKYGFSICGIRKNYYDDPKEDAVLMDAEV